MPLQDAAKPSRKQILAAQRKKYGAYDRIRLAKDLQLRSSYQRRLAKVVHSQSESRPNDVLIKRQLGGVDPSAGASVPASGQSDASTLPTAPAQSGAISPDTVPAPDPADSPVPAGLTQINYGSVGSDNSSPAATHNDTQPLLNTSLASSGSSADAATGDKTDHVSHRTVGLAVGLTVLFVSLAALGYFFKRYRQKLTSPKQKNRNSSQRLGSIDGLKSVSSNGGSPSEDGKMGSRDFLVTQVQVSPSRAGPYDRAVMNMFSAPAPTSPAAQQSFLESKASPKGYLSVTPPKAGLVHQRSLDSIAEAPEPASVTSTSFPLQTIKRDSTLLLSPTPISPSIKRSTWGDRPMTSPGKIGSFGMISPSSRVSPGRPQSAKGKGEIEMTRQGSKLVIRDRPPTLKRPLSSAGSTLRRALRKEQEEGDGAMYIETDDIISRAGEDVLGEPKEAKGLNEGTFELDLPKGRNLRSKFSSSTLRTQGARSSYAATVSPAGSFSFEIRDAVRCPPIKVSEGKEEKGGGVKAENSPALSVEGFVRDLDWDLRDCSISDDAQRRQRGVVKGAAQ